MKKSTVCIIVVALIFVSLSCSPNNGKEVKNLRIIDVGSSVGKGRVVNLSEIASDIKYIPLETDNNSFIGPSPLIFYENERIYIRFSNIIKVFDKTGKYLFTFDRRGGGPEEYPNSCLIEIERGSGKFRSQYLKDEDIVIKTYSREGVFLKALYIRMPGKKYVSRTIKLSSSLYISQFSPQIENDGKEYFAFLYDTLSKIEGYVPSPVLGNNYQMKGDNSTKIGNRRIYMSTIKIFSYLHSFKNLPRIYTFLADTIYTYTKENGLVPVYALDYGKFLDEKVNLNNVSYLKGKFINISSSIYIETENFLILDFILRDFAHEPYTGKLIYNFGKIREKRNSYGLYNKKSGEFTLLNHPIKNKPGFRDDILKGLPFIPQYVSEDNFAVNIFYPDELIDYVANNQVSDELKKIVDTLKDTDNPVVVRVKLRN